MLNRIKDENVAIKQAYLNEINWFVYIFKLIWWSLSIVQCQTRIFKIHLLLQNLLYMDVIFILKFYLIL
jgi:hypothetical protein